MNFVQTSVDRALTPEVGTLKSDTPPFWSRWLAAGRAPGDANLRHEHLAPLQDVWPQ